jgi:hypothetical protein
MAVGSITVSSNPALIPATQPDDGSSVFPVVLVIDEAAGVNWEGGASAFVDALEADYSDLQVTQADGVTPVAFGVAQFSQVGGSRKLIIHLGVPTLNSAVATDYVLHCGVAGGPYENKAGVYPAADNWRGLWTLEEAAAGSGTPDVYQDWTANANHGDDYVVATGKDGKVALGQQFTGVSSSGTDHIVVPYHSSLNMPNAMTIMAWIRPISITHIIRTIAARDLNGMRVFAFIQNSARFRAFVFRDDGRFTDIESTGGHLSAGVWSHVALTYEYVTSGTSIAKFYVDGQCIATNNACVGPLASKTNALWIGAREYSGAEGYFDGNIDEVGFCARTLSANWMLTISNSQATNDAFWTVGEFVSAAARYPAARRSRIYRLGPRLTQLGVI